MGGGGRRRKNMRGCVGDRYGGGVGVAGGEGKGSP